MPCEDGVGLHIPMERAEVLCAVGTGLVQPWERRIVCDALKHASVAAETAVPSTESHDSTDGSGSDENTEGKNASLEEISAAGLNKQEAQKNQQRVETGDGEGVGSQLWSMFFGASKNTSAAATNEEDCNADFSHYSGPQFYLLMEMVRDAMMLSKETSQPLASVTNSTCTFSQRMCWNLDLLTVLLNLLIFHGNVPAVGRFLSVILSSYVMALLFRRCRHGRGDGGIVQSQPSEKRMGQEVEGDKGLSDMRLVQSDAFISLISGLAQIYFPLWHKLRGEGADLVRHAEKKLPAPLLYTRCVPLPLSRQNSLTMWKKMNSNGVRGNPPDVSLQGLQSRIIELVFNQMNTCNVGVGLLPCNNEKQGDPMNETTKKKSVEKEEEKKKKKERNKTGKEGKHVDGEEKGKDVLLKWEHVQEIVVCITLAELGRLVLLSDALYASGNDPHGNHNHHGGQGLKREEAHREAEDRDEDEEKEEEEKALRNNTPGLTYLACVRRCGSSGTVEQMRDMAIILRAVEDEWRQQLPTDISDSTGEELMRKRVTHPLVKSNHRWLVNAVCTVLKFVSQTSGSLCLTPLYQSEQQRECQRPMSYQEKDFYYMNLLLTCCCVAGEQIPKKLSHFALCLTEFTLSNVLMGKRGGEDAPLLQKDTNGRFAAERENAGGQGDGTDSGAERKGLGGDRASNEEAKRQYIAASALCTTTLSFLRCCYKYGSVTLKNEHIRWLSALLRQQVLLWERWLRRAVLLKPLVCKNAKSSKRHVPHTVQKDPDRVLDQQGPHEEACSFVWWHTRILLDYLCVFRDMFTFGATRQFVNDTTLFCTSMQELGKVLQMTCWIDLDGLKATPPGMYAVAFGVVPFPVLAATERRFFIGAMLVYAMGATADTLLAFHRCIENNQACFGDTDDYGNATEKDATNTVSLRGVAESCGGHVACVTEDSLIARRFWVDDFFLSLLLPSFSRVVQAIAFCVPDESMLPAILRLGRSVEFQCVSHIAGVKEHEARERRNDKTHVTSTDVTTTSQTTGQEKNFFFQSHPLSSSSSFSSLWASTPFAETIRVAMGVMALANNFQQVLLSHISRVFAPIVTREDAMARWMMDTFRNLPHSQQGDTFSRCQILLHVVENFVLHVPWAGWASQPLQGNHNVEDASLSLVEGEGAHVESEVSSLSISSKKERIAYSGYNALCGGKDVQVSSTSSSACIGVPSSNHLFSSPVPPPLFEATYMTVISCLLMRLASLDFDWPWRLELRNEMEPNRVRVLLFGLIENFFRGIDDAVFRRSSMREELRLRHRQQQQQQAQNEGSGNGVVSSISYIWDGLMNSLSIWTPRESDTVRARKAEWAAIDAYVDSHHSLICNNVVYIATALYAIERELSSRSPSAVMTDVQSTPYTSLQRLAQHSLESLLSDADVPATWRFLPLSTSCTNDVSLRPATAGMLDGIVDVPVNFLLPLRWLVSSMPTDVPRDSGKSRWEGPPVEGLLLQQASALVRVMTIIAALTQNTTNERGAEASVDMTSKEFSTAAAPIFVLHPAALSFLQWRKLCFALHAMRHAEEHNIASTPTIKGCPFQHLQGCTGDVQEVTPCMHHLQPQGQEMSEGKKHLCFACCTSVECERHYLKPYIEAGLPFMNRSRMDVLICRATTAEERRGLFMVLLMLRRAFQGFFAFADVSMEEYKGKWRGVSKEHLSEPYEEDHESKRYPFLLRKQSRREAERVVLLIIAAFAFGVRPLRCAEELLY
ncbi:hypothetical protein MOQ_010045 [Trypanosoma cruzi marinkellei]|uniref:Uncharacterized protein n=1 Tax=Trypanosoma cruzi marinkellei TaxID=85056 RepID=K2NB52_TRYCR|nr:hypothetical protein MOQ_010045 [Trypanosoma cruzi marinkellei]